MKESHYDLSKLEEEYGALIQYLGKDNLRFEYFNKDVSNMEELNIGEIMNKLYVNIKLTYLPSGNVYQGTEYDSQLENSISAMKKLKKARDKNSNKGL